MIVMTYENVKLEDIYLMVDCYNLIVANATYVKCICVHLSDLVGFVGRAGAAMQFGGRSEQESVPVLCWRGVVARVSLLLVHQEREREDTNSEEIIN